MDQFQHQARADFSSALGSVDPFQAQMKMQAQIRQNDIATENAAPGVISMATRAHEAVGMLDSVIAELRAKLSPLVDPSPEQSVRKNEESIGCEAPAIQVMRVLCERINAARLEIDRLIVAVRV
jgi:hypothetical protein